MQTSDTSSGHVFVVKGPRQRTATLRASTAEERAAWLNAINTVASRLTPLVSAAADATADTRASVSAEAAELSEVRPAQLLPRNCCAIPAQFSDGRSTPSQMEKMVKGELEEVRHRIGRSREEVADAEKEGRALEQTLEATRREKTSEIALLQARLGHAPHLIPHRIPHTSHPAFPAAAGASPRGRGDGVRAL